MLDPEPDDSPDAEVLEDPADVPDDPNDPDEFPMEFRVVFGVPGEFMGSLLLILLPVVDNPELSPPAVLPDVLLPEVPCAHAAVVKETTANSAINVFIKPSFLLIAS
jgi:hypothetical protein